MLEFNELIHNWKYFYFLLVFCFFLWFFPGYTEEIDLWSSGLISAVSGEKLNVLQREPLDGVCATANIYIYTLRIILKKKNRIVIYAMKNLVYFLKKGKKKERKQNVLVA